MAPHIENHCYDHSILTSDPARPDQNSEPVTGLHYTKEDLLSFRPVKDEDLVEKTGSSVIIEKQPSITFKDETFEDVKQNQSQGVGGVEPQRSGTDNDLDEVVLERKKKKKRSGGKNKNKQEAPNGFEGKSLPPRILL
jgi:hypothetical protein